MIRTFRSRDTESLFIRQRCLRFRSIEKRRASEARDAEQRTVVTRSPGSGYLREIGSRNSPAIAKASTAFRVNDQWRICFVWRDRNAYEVESVDYH